MRRDRCPFAQSSKRSPPPKACSSDNAMLPEQKLDAILMRHAALEAELAGRVAPEAYVKLSRELSDLAPVVEKVKAYRDIVAEIQDLDALIEDPATEADMRAMALAEKPDLEAKRIGFEQDIR